MKIIERHLTIAGETLRDGGLYVEVIEVRDEEQGEHLRAVCHACLKNIFESDFLAVSGFRVRSWAKEHAEKCRQLPVPVDNS